MRGEEARGPGPMQSDMMDSVWEGGEALFALSVWSLVSRRGVWRLP